MHSVRPVTFLNCVVSSVQLRTLSQIYVCTAEPFLVSLATVMQIYCVCLTFQASFANWDWVDFLFVEDFIFIGSRITVSKK